MPRYIFFVILMTLLAIAVVVKAAYIMTAKKEYWLQVAARVKADNQDLMPERGNILSCDGRLMASSLPEYKIFVDFRTMHDTKVDTLWEEKEDSICEGLHYIFPERSTEEFRQILREGKKDQTRRCVVWPKRISYSTYMAVKELPIFRLNKNKGGMYCEEIAGRKRPFGDLAARTTGMMYGAKDSAKCGIELSYDSLLRGTKGVMHRRKVLNKFLTIVDMPAENGVDLVTTIDVDMQDLAARALVDELRLPEVNGEMGVAILMEVQTGDIKAIVNMTRMDDGSYQETVNNAISYRCEPGSVFKPASILVALDDGVVDTSYVIHTGGGVLQMYGSYMKDHNWTHGGYGDINVARSLEVSSNIGVSHVIDKYYHNQPEKFIEGLCRAGMNEDLQLPLVGYRPPIIDMPRYDKRHKWLNWDHTKLAWMSIGYNTMIAPINTLTFYNAIANNGKMVKPRFVKQAIKDGQVVKDFPVEVLRERITKHPETIAKMQTVLTHVVSQGLGKKAGSKAFKVAGKTGTAQVSQGKGGYHNGTKGYWLSFAGFFPADNPRYSCIVCIKKWGLPASGGGMSGVVFHNIAEGVMAKDLKLSITDAHDQTSQAHPDVKRGNKKVSQTVLSGLGLKSNGALANDVNTSKQVMPDVKGMGARDAVFVLEKRGIKVQLAGRGKVSEQSIEAGTPIKKGVHCKLTLN